MKTGLRTKLLLVEGVSILSLALVLGAVAVYWVDHNQVGAALQAPGADWASVSGPAAAEARRLARLGLAASLGLGALVFAAAHFWLHRLLSQTLPGLSNAPNLAAPFEEAMCAQAGAEDGMNAAPNDQTDMATQLQAVSSISNSLLSASCLSDLLPLILEQSALLVQASGAAIALRESGSRRMVYRAGSGAWAGVGGRRLSKKDVESASGLSACVPCFIINHKCPRSKTCPGVSAVDYEHVAVLPLIAQEETIGLLWLGKHEPFTTADRQLLQAACGMASGAIQRVTLLEQINRQTVELEQRKLAANLRSITERLSYTLELRVVLNNMLDGLTQITAYDSAAILLLMEDHLEVAAARGFDDSAMVCSLPLTLEKDDPYSRVIITRQPHVIPDTREIKGLTCLDHNSRLRAWMGIPLLSQGGEMIGILNLCSEEKAAYGEQELELTRTFATQAVIAVENARLFGEVQRLATSDGLTGIFNRRYFFELAQRETLRAHRSGSPLAAVMIDIDHFKKVNDTYGHAAGDEVLRALAKTITQNSRDVDIMGRYGGEEFIILMPDTRLAAAAAAAERLRQKVSVMAVDTGEAQRITVTISVGVAVQEGEQVDLNSLIKCADDALYAAKQAGRNRVAGCN